jgi:hypothetical protein
MRAFGVVTAVALLGLVSCGSPPTAGRVIFAFDTGVEVDQVKLEVDVGGVALVTLDVPPTARGQLRAGQDVVVYFEDRLAGVGVEFLAAGLRAGAEVARGQGSLTLVRQRTVYITVTLSPSAGCPASQHECADGCYPDDDTAHCGLSCATCGAAPTHGQAACVSGACSFACNTGFKRCGSECVDTQNDARNCNACGHECDPNQICQAGACVLNSCPTGQHACGGNCVSSLDPATCGSSCAACPAPAHGSATCDGTSCGVTCDSGYHDCSGACAANTSVASCGTRCAACPTVPNTVVGCNGTNCTYACATGFHVCSTSCVSDLDPSHCGDSCTPCSSAPDHATDTCDGTSCGYSCDSGYLDCGGWCQVNGQTCDVCPPCGTGQYCYVAGGVCYTPGQCASNAECVSGSCTSQGCSCSMTGTPGCRDHEQCFINVCYGPL